jgi:probable rRNA maturation factor
MTLSFRNAQRRRRIDTRVLARITRSLLVSDLGIDRVELGVHVVGPAAMATVNQAFLGHEGPTDVITFDHSDRPPRRPGRPEALHGELYICPEVAVRHASEFGTSWPEEVVRYVVHGILHLCGHDDLVSAARRVMKREEDRLVRALAKRFDLRTVQRRA